MNKQLLPLLTIIGLFLGSGCETGWVSSSKISKLTLGESREQVIKSLGIPRNIEAHDDREILWYFQDQGGWTFQPFYVSIVDGRVKAFGPAAISVPGVNVNIQK